ncbi:radical SAM protein [Krasilnikovia sp. MM14-A1259]|uniref:radical SAM protein n=1 Tax=Krasilnikovia sp. MM14-A1259 TaxID=3373539 RepID=UPI0037F82A6A
MSSQVRIWYVSSQRLCNFRCTYCVSINDYAKSTSQHWLTPQEEADFETIVRWMGGTPYRVGVRLATLGEPFASRGFLTRAAWLSKQENVDFIELLTNGSLLKRRLEQLDREGDITKFSLWVTHHETEISVERFIDNARFAQERYGCFVVVNALLFPDNEEYITRLRAAAKEADLRFNLDLGYDPLTPHGTLSKIDSMVPVLGAEDGIQRARRLGADPEVLDLNIGAMRDLRDRSCSAGHRYFYIGPRGDVFRCSRYQSLGIGKLGNVLDDGFVLPLGESASTPCRAGFGCGNKEDYLHLSRRLQDEMASVPSLGWTGVADRLQFASEA